MSFRLTLCVAALILLSGCGGGGGGGGGSSTPPPSASSAVNDQATVDEEGSVTIDVTVNDVRVDEGSLAISVPPGNGTAELSNGQVEYRPAIDFSGSDTFQYRVTGEDGVQRTATVTVTVQDINDPPVAVADEFTIVEDNPLPLTLGSNDTDVDDAITSFAISGDFVGTVSGSGTSLTYTPPLDFNGQVTFTYQALDARGAGSNSVTVMINVLPVTATTLEAVTLAIPRTGYAAGNDAELNATVLRSAEVELVVPPNAVSLLLSLTGPDANINEGGLFIGSLVPPSGLLPAYDRVVHFCFEGSCSALVPRLPAYAAESGTWTYQLGTLASTVGAIDFTGLSLTATFRSGPTPNLAEGESAVFVVRPYLTADTVSLSQVGAVLSRVAELAAESQLVLEIEPVTVITDATFDLVSSSFLDADTQTLVAMGGSDSVNLFFIEDFPDSEDVAGKSGGIPGGLGVNNGHNGVLIDADIFLGFGDEAYIRDTADLVYHEMGHLLGLYHTTEAGFSSKDVIADTPECLQEVHDLNSDGVANASECPDAANPMFWFKSILVEREAMSEDQKHVLFFSPLAAPGGL